MKSTTTTTLSLLSLVTGAAKAAPRFPPRQASTDIPSYSNVDVHTTLLDTTWPWREYKTSSFQPPNMSITTDGQPLADGLIFITPSAIFSANATKEGGGFIMDDTGELVYGIGDDGMTDLRKQTYNGVDYLTYWSGFNTNGLNVGHGYGQVNIVDNQLNLMSAINPPINLNKMSANTSTPPTGNIDIHEHQLTDAGTILLSVYNNTPADLSSVGGPKNGWIVDSLIVEVDIATEDIVFMWKASEHVPFTASHLTVTSPPTPGIGTESQPWDWFHVNSATRVGENYLINSRRCWTMYMVASNGTILWEFAGDNGGDFAAPPANGTFQWQHYVRAHNVTETSMDISIFDNHNAVETVNVVPTRGLVLHLELPPSKDYTPVVLRNIETPSDPIFADSQGSYTPDLPNDNQFINYGQISIAREYGPATDGSDLRWEAQFGGKNQVQNYRGMKEVWSATPASWDPVLVVDSGNVYVSWNGATEVESWNVYTAASNASTSLTQVGVAQKKGFETVFAVPSGAGAVQVGAVQGGEEVRRSNVASV